MESPIIKVSWKREIYEIDVSRMETIKDLKYEISKKSNVPQTEQKIIFKGKILQDTQDIKSIPLKSKLTMLGAASKTAINNNTESKITFVEDLTAEEKLKILREKGEEIVFGLNNLGNTCYLNSTVQCLGRITELRNSLKELSNKDNPSNHSGDDSFNLTYCLGLTYNNLDKASDSFSPTLLVNVIRKINPMFAESENGVMKQQDADECVSLILNNIRNHLTNKSEGDVYSKNLIDELFQIQLQIQLKNVEDTNEIKKKEDKVYKLICYIDSNTIELVEGLKNSLKENIDMFSETLQRNTVFEKSQLINRLPNYLTVQFMRFYWKSANTLTGAKAGKAKILKSVIFSKIIDLYDMCTDETKELLSLGRKIETKLLKDDKNFKIDEVKKEEGKNYIPTGRYQLISVITHQGRSSESGHYIGWVHKKDDKWLKYDDDVVSMKTTNDVLELKGGGDWHMAYICFFKQLEVPFIELDE